MKTQEPTMISFAIDLPTFVPLQDYLVPFSGSIILYWAIFNMR